MPASFFSAASDSDAMWATKRGPERVPAKSLRFIFDSHSVKAPRAIFGMLLSLLLLVLSPCCCIATIALGRNSSCSVGSSSSSSAPFAPFATSSPPFARVEHPLPLTAHWAPSLLARLGQGKGGALPTNKFWQNFVLKPSNQPVMINPLSVRMEAVDTNNLRAHNRSTEYESCETDRFGTRCPGWEGDRAAQVEDAVLSQSGGRRGANFGLPRRQVDVSQVATFFAPGFGFSAAEPLDKHQVVDFDSLSVKVRFTIHDKKRTSEADDDAPNMLLPLVRGMPYATAVYSDLTPFLYTNNAILRCNTQDQPGEVSGNSLRLVLNNDQTVLVYAWSRAASTPPSAPSTPSRPIRGGARHGSFPPVDDLLRWEWNRNTIRLMGGAGHETGRGDWVVRMAFLPVVGPQGQAEAELKHSPSKLPTPQQMESVLDAYADTYPTGGEWSFNFDDEENEESSELDNTNGDAMLHTSFSFVTESRAGTPLTPLLSMSLPHQQETLLPAGGEEGGDTKFVPDLQLVSLLGTMVAVAGSEWRMAISAAPKGLVNSFSSLRPVSDPKQLAALRTQLLLDAQSSTQAGETDPYGFGKSVARIGRMAVMAEELSNNNSNDDALRGQDKEMDALIHRLVTLLKQYLQPWLEGTNPNALLYDTLYGGIVSTNGLKDFGADFGQGLYNDHHFHYGYIAYACAVVAHFDPSWGRGSHRDALLALVRDYANPSLEEGSPGAGQDVDGSFARLRHFDPFDSHSWASGLFVFSDGRNQESSSEAINAYYSLGLLGHALNQPSMRSIGRALMTLEAQGAHFYWHSTDSHSVYPSIFADNKCAGMVWSDKVVDATWFAAGKVYVHGINLLPFTPASELYATSAWAKEQFPVAWASLEQHDAGDDWRGFLRGAQCAFDAPAAWKAIEALTSFDGGNTRANLMHFCATRPPTQQQQQQQMQDDDDVNDFPAVVVGVPSSILLEQPSSALVQDA